MASTAQSGAAKSSWVISPGSDAPAIIQPFTMPGGDVSVRNPYRLALSLLHQHDHEWMSGLPPVDVCPDEERDVIAHQLASGLNTTTTTSAGRLFDAIASLAGVCHVATFEAQAAMEFEALVGDASADGPRYVMPVEDRDGALVITHAELIDGVLADLANATTPDHIAARFHRGLAHGVLASAESTRARTGITRVGLSGGVFQNRVLTTMCEALLDDAGFVVLTHRLVPPNDAGLALGQVALAAHRL